MDYHVIVERVGLAIDLVGVAVIVVGTLLCLGRYLVRALRRRLEATSYRDARQQIGKSILLGLELLVAGDIIRTVATSPTFTSVGVLAAIVGVRTFLSFTMMVELDGRWPWQKRSSETPAMSEQSL
jgi:uncharacterized membrane protein